MNSEIAYKCDLDISPNSHDYPTKKSIVLVRRMKFSILGMKLRIDASAFTFMKPFPFAT